MTEILAQKGELSIHQGSVNGHVDLLLYRGDEEVFRFLAPRDITTEKAQEILKDYGEALAEIAKLNEVDMGELASLLATAVANLAGKMLRLTNQG